MIAVTLGMLMSLMDSTIVNVAIPQMQHSFGASIRNVQWVVTIYMLTQAIVIPTAPYLTTRFGGKRAYIWTLSAFLLGSLLCGFAWNLPSLIFFRCIQGIGGGILLPLVMTLLYQAFPLEQRGMAVSIMGIPLMVAPMLGPVLGGYLVGSFGWQWAFFLNVPLGIIALVIAQKVLTHVPGEQQASFDGTGFLTIAFGSAALLYAVSLLTSGDTALQNVLLLCGGILLLIAFVVIEGYKERHGKEPLLNLRLFNNILFTRSTLAFIFVTFVRFGILFLIPIYLQTLHQETAWQAGMIQAAQALATLIILPIAGRLADSSGPRSIVIVGLLIFIGAMSCMVTLALHTAIWLIVGILLLLGCAYGCLQQLPVAAMSQIEKERQQDIAHGSTLVTVLQALAAPLGVTVIASFVQARSQIYMSHLATQRITGTLLHLQSVLQAMHESFLMAIGLLFIALVVMCLPLRHSIRPQALPILVTTKDKERINSL